MTVIAPSNAQGWWARARLELMTGNRVDARGSLSAMLEVTREPAMRSHIFAALEAISGASS